MRKPDYGVENETAVVTGASQGIGKSIAETLAAGGADVSICSRSMDRIGPVADSINDAEGGDALAVECDVRERERVEEFVEATVDEFGDIDVLVNNMGMNLPAGNLVDTETGMWQKIIDSNLTSTFMCARRAGKIMQGQKFGRIVSVTSVAAHKASPGLNVYGIAKSAIEMMTKNLAFELAGDNIQVNAVAPAMVRTDFSKPFWSNPEIHDMVVKNIPMGRIAEPEEVARVVLFLASDAASFMTGQTLLVAGGSMGV